MDTELLNNDSQVNDEEPQVNPLDELFQEYWAACSSDEIGERVLEKVEEYDQFLRSSNLVELWRKSYKAYYSMDPNNDSRFAVGSIFQTGSQGEIAKIKINQFRNFAVHVHTLITAQRPAMRCRAINSDTASLTQATLGNGILDYFMREKKLERNLKEGCEIAILVGEAFNRLDWDARAGKAYGVGENGQKIFDGDVTITTYTPFQVARDVTRNSAKNHDYYVFNDQVNKYDLAAKYSKYAKQIIDESPAITSRISLDPSKIIANNGMANKTSDQIDIFTLLHNPTAACPSGRMSIVTHSGQCVFDGPLPFPKMPVSRISAGDIVGAAFGWTIAFDALAIQELLDKLYSMWATNNLAGGIQMLWQPPGNGLANIQLGPLALLESVIEPKVISLCQTPAELPNLIAKLESVLGVLFSVSDINRGEVSEKGLSGAAMALLASQSLTFNSNLQASYNEQLEDVGSSLIDILKDYAATPRLAAIAGDFNRPSMSAFTGKDLASIDRVVVEATSAISRTAEGKIQLAQMMLATNPPMITTPRELMQVITTGNLEVLYEGDQASLLLIKAENDALRKGEPVRVIKYENHPDHITEHLTLLSSIEAKEDMELCERVQQHVDDHLNAELMMQQTQPGILQMLRMPPIPQGQPQQPPQPSPQQAPGQSGPNGMPQLQNPNGEPAQPNQPKMPNLPGGADPQAVQAYNQLKGR